jgi:GntR family transcriptional regulator
VGAGDSIPSEGELASRFNVSQGTVRKAIDEMAAENMLVRRQGKGTFVATHSDPRSFYRFLRLVPDSGRCPPSATPFIVKPLRQRLKWPRCWVSRRVIGWCMLSACCASITSRWFSIRFIWLRNLFDGLTLDALRGGERSLYSLFESDFGVRMINAEEHLRAVVADAQSAELLGVQVGDPLLLVERTAYTYGNKPVEWRRGLYCTRHHYTE